MPKKSEINQSQDNIKKMSRRDFLISVRDIVFGLAALPVLGSQDLFSAIFRQQSQFLQSDEVRNPNNQEREQFTPLKVGDIDFRGIEQEDGSLVPVTLTIHRQAQIREEEEFIVSTFPTQLTAENTGNPAGNWREDYNPTFLNGVNFTTVQTAHSGFPNNVELQLEPIRAEIQEVRGRGGANNVNWEEGAQRREYFRGAEITLEQNDKKEVGELLGIFHIDPEKTAELEEAYLSGSQPVNLLDFSDYDGPPLDPRTDVIYFFCVEAYAGEITRRGANAISQGRGLMIVRIDLDAEQ